MYSFITAHRTDEYSIQEIYSIGTIGLTGITVCLVYIHVYGHYHILPFVVLN